VTSPLHHSIRLPKEGRSKPVFHAGKPELTFLCEHFDRPHTRIIRGGHEFGDLCTTRVFDPWTVHFSNSVIGLCRAPYDWERKQGDFRGGGK
jgi:hypothetical protein